MGSCARVRLGAWGACLVLVLVITHATALDGAPVGRLRPDQVIRVWENAERFPVLNDPGLSQYPAHYIIPEKETAKTTLANLEVTPYKVWLIETAFDLAMKIISKRGGRDGVQKDPVCVVHLTRGTMSGIRGLSSAIYRFAPRFTPRKALGLDGMLIFRDLAGMCQGLKMLHEEAGRPVLKVMIAIWDRRRVSEMMKGVHCPKEYCTVKILNRANERVQEGRGLSTLVDGLSAGKAVVTTDMRYFKGYMEEGVNGLIARAGNATSYMVAYRKMLSPEGRAIQERAYEDARTGRRMSANIFLKAVEELCRAKLDPSFVPPPLPSASASSSTTT